MSGYKQIKIFVFKNDPGYLGNVLAMKVMSGFLGCWLSVFSLYFVSVYFPRASGFLVFASVCVHYVQSVVSCPAHPSFTINILNQPASPAFESTLLHIHTVNVTSDATLFNWNMETTGVTKQIQCIAVSVMTTLAAPGVIRVKLFIINELWSAPKGKTLLVHEFLQCVCVCARVPG